MQRMQAQGVQGRYRPATIVIFIKSESSDGWKPNEFESFKGLNCATNLGETDPSSADMAHPLTATLAALSSGPDSPMLRLLTYGN